MARAVRRGRLIVHGDGARAALMRGLDLVADAVAPTLGPAGSHVVLHRHDAGPLITNDGVTIARSIELLRDPYTNQGVQLLREVAGVADTTAGDGTSTAVLVARELLRQVFSMVTRNSDAAALCDGLRHGWAGTARLIREAAEPLRDDDELAALAGNAARDPSIGEMIALALARVGDDGVVNVEDDPAYGVRLEFTDGMSFASGLLSPGLALDEVKGETVFERPYILLASERLTRVEQLAPVLERVAAERIPLVVIADEVSAAALTTMVVNMRRRTLPSVAVKAPLFGEDRVAMLEDMAALTGARVLGPGTGRCVEHAELGDLGRAERVTVTADRTTISNGDGSEQAVQARLARIGAELAYLESEYERDKRRLRRACLVGTVATIKIGLDTVVEQEETRLRVIDGIRSGRAAMRSGVVPGGGSLLIQAADALTADGAHADTSLGAQALARALQAPLRQLAINAGMDPSVAVSRVRAAPAGFGLDLRSNEVVDLRRAGVVDATEVVCTALESAVSIGLTAVLAETIVAQRPLPPNQQRPYGHHHGHDHGHFGGVAPGHEHVHDGDHGHVHAHAGDPAPAAA